MTFTLRTILAGLTLAAVLVTAALVHTTWLNTARGGVDRAIAATERQIVTRVQEEVDRVFTDARGTLRALHTVLLQRVIAPTDAAKREFLFLAHLQSHQSLTWVSFGFPDGTLFGARRSEDGGIQMVEASEGTKNGFDLRVDHYTPEEDDIFFRMRTVEPTETRSVHQPWYQLGASGEANSPIRWTEIHPLPVDQRPAVTAALPLYIFEDFIGVVSVSVGLNELDKFLSDLEVGDTGTVFVVDRKGKLVAAPSTDDAGSEVINRTLMTIMGKNLDLGPDAMALQLKDRLARDGETFYVGVAPLASKDWLVVTVIPESDFTATIVAGTERLAVLLLVLVAAVGICALVASQQLINKPLRALAAQIDDIKSFELGRVHEVPSRITEVRDLAAAMKRMAGALQGIVRFVPAQLVRSLVTEGTATRSERREATLLYLDIAGFTALGESLGPEALVALLNDYFSSVDAQITAHGGTVMQFQGDAILAAFNAPADNPEHAASALDAALSIVHETSSRPFGAGQHLNVRIGLNTGTVLSATVGSMDRADYTLHGDAVNLSARLEQLNKEHGSSVIASHSTLEHAGRLADGKPLGTIMIRGKTESVSVYSLA